VVSALSAAARQPVATIAAAAKPISSRRPIIGRVWHAGRSVRAAPEALRADRARCGHAARARSRGCG
jgi:hypothetical protein